MKILLLGEYSNVHATLAEGLRTLGHEVTVVSNGDFWKDYPRDIDVSRKPGKTGGLRLLARLYTLLPRLRGYDIVQLINPLFFELKAKRLFFFYDYLRRHNGKVYLGAFGMDWYWVHACTTTKPLRYSDFNIGNELRTNEEAIAEQKDWLGTEKERLNRYIAEDCNGIVTGLYEYDVCYRPQFPDKTRFIPYPIHCPGQHEAIAKRQPVSIFIGINRSRSAYKGTDIMLRAAQAIEQRYGDRIKLNIAESIPFEEYKKLMDGSDAILDQLYSYTPSMNSLLAMSKGIICIGGGEPENYEILGERELSPIINVQPNYESVYQELENLVLHPERIPELKRQSIEYIRRHHDHLKVARQYLDFWTK
ncbi:MAG: glycosyltransferase family 1 protein [Prevotella sp.]|nr:glycosyltransferase family 1 protein [Prevotella sp.]